MARNIDKKNLNQILRGAYRDKACTMYRTTQEGCNIQGFGYLAHFSSFENSFKSSV